MSAGIFLTRQIYPTQLIESAIRKSTETTITESDQLNNVMKATSHKFLLFPPTIREITICLNQPNSLFLILQQSENLQKLIQHNDILHRKRQPPNLKKSTQNVVGMLVAG